MYDRRVHVKDHTLNLDGDYYHRRIHIDHKYNVAAEAWHNVMFLMCNRPDYYSHHGAAGLQEHVSVSGSNAIVASVGAAAASSKVVAGAGGAQHAVVGSSLIGPTLSSVAGAAVAAASDAISIAARKLSTAQQLIREQHMQNVRRGSAAVVQLASSDSNPLDPVAQLSGTITFRNPYGFIPAEMYGMLPFEVRMIHTRTPSMALHTSAFGLD